MFTSFLIQTLNGLASASLLFLVGLGLTLIFGVTRIVNFAHGSLYMLGLYIAASIAGKVGGALGFWGGAVAAALVVALIGAAIEVVILKRIYAAPELLQLITTFGIVLVVKDAALWIWGPDDILGPRAPGFKGAIEILGRQVPSYDLLLIFIGPLFLLGIWLLLTRTRWGTLVRAATQDREMAAALGVNQAVLFTTVFALGSFLAGLSGALSMPREPANLTMDLGIIADVFVVTVVGGLGSIPGAYIAAIIVSVVKSWCIGIGDVNLAGTVLSFSKLTLVAEFIVMAVVLIWRPWGLFGREPPLQRQTILAATPIDALGRGDLKYLMPVGLLIAVVPFVTDQYTVVLATDIALFALFSASLGLMMGWGGMASFGHAAYFGAGAYAAAIMAKAGHPFLLAVPTGVAVAGALAGGFGWLCVRLSGVSLAMLTMALAQIVWAVAFQWDAVTGGSNGLVGIWPPAWLTSKRAYYGLAVSVAVLAILALWSLAHSPFGYALRASRDSILRAEAIGIDTRRIQWIAFTLAGMFAGLAGALFVFSKGSLSPDSLSIPRSMDGLVMVLLGGVQTLIGPVVGAAVFIGLQDWITRAMTYWQAVLGASVIMITVLFPLGLVGTVRAWWPKSSGGDR